VKPERPRLPPRAASRLDDFENPKVLGASRQLSIASDLLISVAEEYRGDSPGLVQQICDVVDYLVALRGASSQAVPNALNLMLDGLDDRGQTPIDQLRALFVDQVRAYDAEAADQMRRIADYGAALAAGSKRLLAYDYSSSVAAILRTLNELGESPTVVVPEARPLDGGRRYIEDLRESSLRFELVPDAAIGTLTRGCELALVGAETVSAEGGCYNTIGTLLVALACEYWRVPLYSPTTLVKIDTRTLHGFQRRIPSLGAPHLKRLTAGWTAGLKERVVLACPDLDYVPPKLMSGFVTEVGVLPPASIAGHAARMAKAAWDD